MKTYIAMGKGLKKAKLTGVHYQNFKQLLGHSDYAEMKNIQKGYESKLICFQLTLQLKDKQETSTRTGS